MVQFHNISLSGAILSTEEYVYEVKCMFADNYVNW